VVQRRHTGGGRLVAEGTRERDKAQDGQPFPPTTRIEWTLATTPAAACYSPPLRAVWLYDRVAARARVVSGVSWQFASVPPEDGPRKGCCRRQPAACQTRDRLYLEDAPINLTNSRQCGNKHACCGVMPDWQATVRGKKPCTPSLAHRLQKRSSDPSILERTQYSETLAP